MKKLVVMLVVILAISAPAFAANLLVNGDFETAGSSTVAGQPSGGATGNVVGWTYWNSTVAIGSGLSFGMLGSAAGTSGAGCQYTSATSQHGGANSLFMSVKSAGRCGFYQTVSLTAGHTYILDGYLQKYGTYWGETSAQWSTSSMGIFAGTYSGSGEIDQPDSGATFKLKWGNTNGSAWQQLSTCTASNGPGTMSANPSTFMATTTGTYTVWIKTATANTSSYKNFSRWDDLSLTEEETPPIPEPGSMLALLTGLVGAVGIIRRKR